MSTQASDTVADGVVISSDPAPGTPVDPDSGVGLVVSSGAAPCVLPDVTGMPRAQAEQVIAQSCGTLGGVDKQLSADIPADVVISSKPGACAEVTPGQAVTLVVTKRGVRVPKVAGELRPAAETAIEGAELAVGTVTFDGSRNDDTVSSSSPGAGKVVEPGSMVDLVVYSVVVG